ncbi:hypothetical protein [Herbiconiux ginsengi]|uniref:Uncharacterized protein n=1 Tax=Herbiconiux ginsengi TaxID=381665 RepID=A0A1H3QTI1_9MICO|nr:hypothetical protein [Herbiconiux ginsengi]SDZ16640.1 hypothetical protein SAMN05216554_2731 [Herbiconiux ginsengi]
MTTIGRATVPLRIAAAAGIVLGILGIVGALLLPHDMTCTSAGDCRTVNDLFFAIAMIGRIVGAPLAAAGSFAIGLSLLTTAFRPPPAPEPESESDPRREATMTRDLEAEATTPRILAPARALWTYALVLFAVCATAAVFVSLPLTQIAFGSSCDENGCTYSALSTVIQVAGFLAPSVMIASLLIVALAIVASTINRHGGIRVGGASDRDQHGHRRGHGHSADADGLDRRDPDAELDELLEAATDDMGRVRSRGPATWRGGDLTPFMRPPSGDGADAHDVRD